MRKVTLSQERDVYGVEMRAEPNYPTLGKKAGGQFLCLIIQCIPQPLLFFFQQKSNS